MTAGYDDLLQLQNAFYMQTCEEETGSCFVHKINNKYYIMQLRRGCVGKLFWMYSNSLRIRLMEFNKDPKFNWPDEIRFMIEGEL